MNDEILIFNDVNPYTGMRALLVKRPSQAVEIGKWLELVPEEKKGKVVFDQYELEQGAFMWHYLAMQWPPRELIGFEVDNRYLAAIDGWQPMVKVNDGAAIPAVSWALERGERMSGAIRSAAELYWGAIGQYPQVALVRVLPKDAPGELEIAAGKFVRLLVMEWVWRGMVVVL